MRITVQIKNQPAETPGWRVPQKPANVPALIGPALTLQDLRPRHDQVHYETHFALPSSLKRALDQGHQHYVNRAMEWAASRIPFLCPVPTETHRSATGPEITAERWRDQNRVYVTAEALVYIAKQHRSRQSGLILMEKILWADLLEGHRARLHTADTEYIFPPLCRPVEMVNAVNRILRAGESGDLPPSCQDCKHYRRRLMPGNRGDCALQPELSKACCPLNGFYDRCQRHQSFIAKPASRSRAH